MRIGSVHLSGVTDQSRRLTGAFHLAEDQQVIQILEQRVRSGRYSRLGNLTTGRGIFRGPIFRRIFATDPARGRPYVSAADLVHAHVRPTKYLSSKHGALLEDLSLRRGLILLTCSGMNLGKAIWTREDMYGLCASHDLIRIEPDAAKVPPGFVFAFLASRFGRVSVRKQIYGGNIKHIEPHHIVDLVVPRLDAALERRVHDLVEEAAQLRSDASRDLGRLVQELPELLGLRPLLERGVGSHSVSAVRFSELEGRLDAPFHSAAALEVERQLDRSGLSVELLPNVVARHFKPPMFKRLWTDGPEHGTQFVSGSDVYRHEPQDARYVSHKIPAFDDFILHRGWVGFQAAGQVYGIFAQPFFVSDWLEGVFCADDVYRLVPHSETDGGYLYAFLRTPHGQALLKRQACGNSIPRVWDPHMRRVRVPWPNAQQRGHVGDRVIEGHSLLERARQCEQYAIMLVESAIEEET